MSQTLWIFILNSYPKDISSQGYLQRIQTQIDNLPGIIESCQISYEAFINLTKDKLYEKLLELVKKDKFTSAKNLIFVFRGHGGEFIQNKAIGMVSLDGKTVFFHRIVYNFLRNIEKNVYMFVDMCRAPIDDQPLDDNSLSVNRGNFILVHGTARSEVGYGVFGKYFFENINKICQRDINLLKILLFIKLVILSARYEDNELNAKIYVNQAVRSEYPALVTEVQKLTQQDNGSIMATKIGMDRICLAIQKEISTHKHQPLVCSASVRSFIKEDCTRANIIDKCIDTCATGLGFYLARINAIRNGEELYKFYTFDYFKDLNTDVYIMINLGTTLETAGYLNRYPNVVKTLDSYLALYEKVDVELIPIFTKANQSYQALDLIKTISILEEFSKNKILTQKEVKRIEIMINDFKKVNKLRNSGDIFDRIKNLNYFSTLQGLLNNNLYVDKFSKMEKEVAPFRKKYIESGRTDIKSLQIMSEYFGDISKSTKITDNEKVFYSDLYKQYKSRL